MSVLCKYDLVSNYFGVLYFQVCALLGGGGYAEKVCVHESHCLPIPKGISLTDAASLPEVTCTVWSTTFMTSKLAPGESFLVHGGSSGIGTFAIQIAKAKGCKVFTTVGSAGKIKFVTDLGADLAINYKEEDFVAKVKEATGGKGVDVILDNMGASYFQKNLDALGMDGRLFSIGFMGGLEAQVNLSPFVYKRLTYQSAGLRGRTNENKSQIVDEVKKYVWPLVESGKVKTIIDTTFPLGEASKAHELLESSTHMGKVLLTP
jgi:putative PIG3 family NAD(P)H quinone oxidoreductase